MSTPVPISPGRYRRRILGLGGLALVVAFVIGAAIFIPVVQNDLEDRVGAELADAGIDGVNASFSGQDGTLTCDERLDNPAAVRTLAAGVHGVRVVELDDTCSRAEPSTAEEPEVTEAPEAEPEVTEPPVTAPTATTATPPATQPELDGIVDIVEGDPLFRQLAGVLVIAALDGEGAFGGDGPFTLLAPTDAAFDAAFDELGADPFKALMSNPDALRSVLLHHATAGAIASTEFVAGDLAMLDGTTIAVDPAAADGITFTSNGAASSVDDPTTQLDIEASNGVVHAINRLLIPEGLDLGGSAPATSVGALLAGGQITLSGVVQTEEQRTALMTAARAQVDPANAIDQLTVDPNSAIDQASLDRFAAVVAVMSPNLADGEATLVGDTLTLKGTYLGEAAQAALSQIGAEREVTLELSPRQTADPDSAAALQSELNDFVRGNPILFEPNSATLTPDANAIIEQLAARAARLAGTAITIVGHTDSDGNPATNQTLSEVRAASVGDALVARGLDAATLTSAGRGASEPITDESGAQDKAASRRVEFIVEAT